MIHQDNFTIPSPNNKIQELQFLKAELAKLMAEYKSCLDNGYYIPNTLDNRIEDCQSALARIEAVTS